MKNVCNTSITNCREIVVSASNVKHANIADCVGSRLFLQDFSYVSFEKLVDSVVFVNNILLGPSSTIILRRATCSVVVLEHTSFFTDTFIV